jgi:predicted YcjX-like family ATPase
LLSQRLGGRRLHVATAPAAASNLPRFDIRAHLDALIADPPRWPARTEAVSLLALDIRLPRSGPAAALPPRMFRLEFLDYPGEWLLDLPLLGERFGPWSETVLRRLEAPDIAPFTRDFLAFAQGLPMAAPADDALAASGHRLYAATLRRLRDEARLSLLQPGRFLMPAPGPPPPSIEFFPLPGRSPLATLLGRRFDAYVEAVRRDLASPMFGDLDRLVVLADVLSALHAGRAAFADAQAALAAAAAALRWRSSWTEWLTALARLELPPRVIRRVAFAATKADHVGERQRNNLAALVRRLAAMPESDPVTAAFALASVRCTEDVVDVLAGRPVSAVRGRLLGQNRPARSYPGEVPDTPPDDAFWQHRFLALPDFEPMRPPENGRGGIAQIGLDPLLAFLLDDVL